MDLFATSEQLKPNDAVPEEFGHRIAGSYSPPEGFARKRGEWYGLLSGCCNAPPTEAVIDRILDGTLVESVTAILGPEVAEDWSAFAKAADRPDVKSDFMNLFKVPSSQYLTPNESVWADRKDVDGIPRQKPLLMGPATIDAQRRYQRFSLEVERESGELADFFGLELTFLEQLCLLEADAWEIGDHGIARFLLDQQRSWIEDHLDRWVDPLCEAMAKNARTSFYRGLARLIPAFIDIDRATLHALLDG